MCLLGVVGCKERRNGGRAFTGPGINVGDGAPVISAVYMVKPGDAWQLYRIR